MPFIPAAVAAIGSAIASATAAVVAGTATVLSAIGVPLAIAKTAALIAVPFLFQTGATMLLTAGITALTTPKIHSTGLPTQWRADTNAGIPYCMGTTGVAGNIIAELTSYGDKNKYLHFVTVLSGAGPIDSFVSQKANDTVVSFDGSGACTTSPYAGRMWMTTQLGASTDPVLAAPTGTGVVPEWDGAHKMTGYAAHRLVLEYDQSVYPTGVPKPITKLKGVKVYDPRLDSTYPGGSGSHRYGTESTYEWSANPWLHALTYIIGRYQNGKRVIGLGASAGSVDIAAFVDAANVADANSWTISGQVTSKDDKWQCLQAMAQAGGGSIVRLGGQISCVVQTPRSSIATVTGSDIVAGVQVPGTQTRRARINSVLFRYQDENHGWQMTPASKVSVSSYVSVDGDTRTRPVDFPLVSDVHQGAQLATYGIYDSRELAPITLPLKPSFSGLKAGDVITVNEPEIGLNGQDLFVVARERDPKTGVCTLTCRTETYAKHAAALATSGTAAPTPSLTGVDIYTVAAPASGDWSATGATFTDGGVSFPAIVVTGACPDPVVSDVIVEIKPHSASSWAVYGTGPAQTTTRQEITGLTPGTVYDVGISYRKRGIVGSRLTISSVTAGSFAGSGASADYVPDAIDWANITATSSSPAVATSSTKTFTGIDGAITVDVSWTGTGTGEYSKNGAAWTAMTSGDDLVISPSDTLAFRMTRTGSAGTSSGTVTVTNLSVGSPATVIDTFDYSCTVSASDVTPDALNWSNIWADGSYVASGYNANQTISGIDTTITLRMEDDTGTPLIQYSKNGGGLATITSGDTITVNNGDTLRFYVLSGTAVSGTISIYNDSDGGAFIDAFNYDLYPY